MSNTMDAYTSRLNQCNEFLKTREGLKTLLSVKGCDWPSEQPIAVPVEHAVKVVQESWTNDV